MASSRSPRHRLRRFLPAVLTGVPDITGGGQADAYAAVTRACLAVSRCNSGKAPQVQGTSTADGANTVQYSDCNGANQQWRPVRVG